MANGTESNNLTELAADIVSAYVSNNSVPVGELPGLISQVHGALHQTVSGGAAPAEEPQKPAVPIRRSVSQDYIVCLEDGKRFKSLKRHLRTDHNMTPQEYRAKWGLPADYPMVAPSYAQARSDLAKKMGLGQARRSGGGAKSAAKPAARRGGGGRGRGARAGA
jgi:predicted transcriptional regulator